MLIDQYIAEVKSYGSRLQEDGHSQSVHHKFAECVMRWKAYFSISHEDLISELNTISSQKIRTNRNSRVSTWTDAHSLR